MESADKNPLDQVEMEVSTSGIPFYRTFCDIDELASSLPEKVRLTQLSLGSFRCDTSALIFENIWFNFNRVERPIYAIGDKRQDFLSFICLPYPRRGNVLSHAQAMTEACLYGFDTGRGVETVFPANTTHCGVYVHRGVFQDCIEAMDRGDIDTAFFSSNYAHIPENLPPLHAYLRELHELLRQRSPLLSS
jgi:hypothetical protein